MFEQNANSKISCVALRKHLLALDSTALKVVLEGQTSVSWGATFQKVSKKTLPEEEASNLRLRYPLALVVL